MKKIIFYSIYAALWIAIGLAFSFTLTWLGLWLYNNKATPDWQRDLFAIPYFSWVEPTETGWMRQRTVGGDDGWFVNGIRYARGGYQTRFYANKSLNYVPHEYDSSKFPEWAPVLSPPSEQEKARGAQRLFQFTGWPYLAWKGSANTDAFYYQIECQNAFPNLMDSSRDTWDSLVLFPYQPVFPGVLYNALFFGSILFITVRIIKHTRRRITDAVRISRHQCTKCKYDITGLTTCPECGQTVAAKA